MATHSEYGAFMEKFTLQPPQSSSSPQHLPLAGLTFAVKDIFDVDGYVTGFGNPDWAKTHSAAVVTAPAVISVLNGGAVCVGKTVMDEMTYSINGENAHYGTPTNPSAPDRVPGGSSSGSAVAVSSQHVDFSLGTDTGGSVRVPAAFCGILGFGPSHAVISTTGVIPMAQSFDTVGWFARDPVILNRVGRVLLQIPVAASVQPSCFLVPDDCFQLLNIPSERLTHVIINSVEKLFGFGIVKHMNLGTYISERVPSLNHFMDKSNEHQEYIPFVYTIVEQTEPLIVAIVEKSLEFSLCVLEKSAYNNGDLSIQNNVVQLLEIALVDGFDKESFDVVHNYAIEELLPIVQARSDGVELDYQIRCSLQDGSTCLREGVSVDRVLMTLTSEFLQPDSQTTSVSEPAVSSDLNTVISLAGHIAVVHQ